MPWRWHAFIWDEKLEHALCLQVVECVRNQLHSLERKTLTGLIVMDVHARDVTAQLAEQRVSSINDFKWTSQLRRDCMAGRTCLMVAAAACLRLQPHCMPCALCMRQRHASFLASFSPSHRYGWSDHESSNVMVRMINAAPVLYKHITPPNKKKV